jgi:hypothetical protein
METEITASEIKVHIVSLLLHTTTRLSREYHESGVAPERTERPQQEKHKFRDKYSLGVFYVCPGSLDESSDSA